MADEYKDKGLIIVAPHRQAGTKEEVIAVAQKNKINYSVFESGSVEGGSGSGLPYCYVFDADGKLTYEGRDGHKAVEEAIARAPDMILGPNDYQELRKEAANILGRKAFGKTMQTLRELKDGEGAEAEEAVRMFERLDKHATSEWTRITGLKENRPSQLQAELKAFSKNWKGDEYGTNADAELEAIKADDGFKDLVKADVMLMSIEKQLEGAKACKFAKPLDLATCGDCQSKNSKLLKSVGSTAGAILGKYPDTPAAKRAEEILTSSGIPH